MLKSKEIFALAIRLIGLYFLFLGLQAIPFAFDLFVSSFPHDLGPGAHVNMNFGGMFKACIMVGWPFLVAQWLVRGAPLVMEIAYPDNAADTKTVPPTDTTGGPKTSL